MMAHKMNITLNALESRVVAVLTKRYPITTDELGEELSVRPDTLKRTLKTLEVKGVLILEPLPDKSYIRLVALGAGSISQPYGECEDEADEHSSIAYR